jgi:hypothetical protein
VLTRELQAANLAPTVELSPDFAPESILPTFPTSFAPTTILIELYGSLPANVGPIISGIPLVTRQYYATPTPASPTSHKPASESVEVRTHHL